MQVNNVNSKFFSAFRLQPEPQLFWLQKFTKWWKTRVIWSIWGLSFCIIWFLIISYFCIHWHEEYSWIKKLPPPSLSLRLSEVFIKCQTINQDSAITLHVLEVTILFLFLYCETGYIWSTLRCDAVYHGRWRFSTFWAKGDTAGLFLYFLRSSSSNYKNIDVLLPQGSTYERWNTSLIDHHASMRDAEPFSHRIHQWWTSISSAAHSWAPQRSSIKS